MNFILKKGYNIYKKHILIDAVYCILYCIYTV